MGRQPHIFPLNRVGTLYEPWQPKVSAKLHVSPFLAESHLSIQIRYRQFVKSVLNSFLLKFFKRFPIITWLLMGCQFLLSVFK